MLNCPIRLSLVVFGVKYLIKRSVTTTAIIRITKILRRTGNVRLSAYYTLQFADGTGSTTTTAAALVNAGLPNLRILTPLAWDRRHQFNVFFDYRYGEGKDYSGPVIKREKKGV